MTSAKVFAAPKAGVRSKARSLTVRAAAPAMHGKGGEEGGAVLGNDAFGMVAKIASYSMFATAAQKAPGVREILESPGPITVFAANDTAMEAFCANAGKTRNEFYDHPNLAGIMMGMIVQGPHRLENMPDGTQLTTMAGTTITVSGGKVNGANMTKNDIKVDNAILHAVDAVILG